jgi:HK97 family phage portal protein
MQIIDKILSPFRSATTARVEHKASATKGVVTMHGPAHAVWTPRNYGALAKNGVMKNPVVYRCVRLIAEAAASVPLQVCDNHGPLEGHDITGLLAAPNGEQSGAQLLEEFYASLQTAGNAYLEAVRIDGVVRELWSLRPDRMRVRASKNGWPIGYEYQVDGQKTLFRREGEDGFMPILHMKLFHPLHDHYGLSPLEAAGMAVDIHNAASSWNKSLLDNAARPSGALIYKGVDGAENLTAEQFERLKAELSQTYAGRSNAGRPLVLDGGLDWKPMSMTPSDMDFINAKHAAAREIALAFGVPPMLLGIPGDNTYSTYREANLAFWRQTIIPLVQKTGASLSQWLCAAQDNDEVVRLTANLNAVDALSSDRIAHLQRVLNADFLTAGEKRQALGYPALPQEDGHDAY